MATTLFRFIVFAEYLQFEIVVAAVIAMEVQL